MELLKEALFYERLPDGHVRCTLCPHECKIGLDKRGICGVPRLVKHQIKRRIRNCTAQLY